MLKSLVKKTLAIGSAIVGAVSTMAITVSNGVLTFGTADDTLLNNIVQAVISNVWAVIQYVAIPFVAIGALYLAVGAIKKFFARRQHM